MENIKKIFLAENDNLDNNYLFSPSIDKRKTIGSKTYYVKSYFNGEIDFESSMLNFAISNYYKNRR